ncbi:MAG: NAD-dependent epimerase/dehydratase family protein [Deltaproteobacteria bacterium]|nr:NAD-dependent epimerase/dehydratase family protein [Deltaproteobacteria bacterium]
MKVLVMGISGGIARLVAIGLRERGHEVFGIDRRPWPGAPRGVDVYGVDLRKRAAEDIFRRRRPDVVIHLATVNALTAHGEERSRINLGGTRAVFEHALSHGVEHVVFVGRHTYYGAAADSPLYHTEDEPPQALGAFPELADLVAADLYAANTLWRNPKLVTTVLRLCYTLGPSRMGTLATFVKPKRVPMVLGYDPLFQFLWEADAAEAVILAAEKRPRGIFNVASCNPLPLATIVRQLGRTPLPLPEPLLLALLGRAGFPRLPRGAVEHIKYPILVDAGAFRAATGFQHRVDEVETLRKYRSLFAAGELP